MVVVALSKLVDRERARFGALLTERWVYAGRGGLVYACRG